MVAFSLGEGGTKRMREIAILEKKGTCELDILIFLFEPQKNMGGWRD